MGAQVARAIPAVILASTALTGRAAADGPQTADWLALAGGDWTDPANWSSAPVYPNNGVPTAADTYAASIRPAGTPYTIWLEGDVTVDRLLLDSPDATIWHVDGTLTAREGITLSAGAFELAINDHLRPTIANTTIRSMGGELRIKAPAGDTVRNVGVLSGVALAAPLTLEMTSDVPRLAVLRTTATRAVVSGARAIETPVNVDSNSISVVGTRLSRFRACCEL